MILDSITLIDGSTVDNLTIASGTVDPAADTAGELFFRTDLGKLRVYNGSAWINASSVDSFNSRTGAITLTAGDVTNALTYDPAPINIPQNIQNTAYTFALADAGKHVYHSESTTARTYTVPPNSTAFLVGTAITIVNLNGSGAISIAQGVGVTIRLAGPGTTGTRTLAANGIATLLKVDTNTWYVSGVGLT